MVEQSKWAHFGSYAPDPANGRPAGRSYPVQPIPSEPGRALNPRAIFPRSHAKCLPPILSNFDTIIRLLLSCVSIEW